MGDGKQAQPREIRMLGATLEPVYQVLESARRRRKEGPCAKHCALCRLWGSASRLKSKEPPTPATFLRMLALNASLTGSAVARPRWFRPCQTNLATGLVDARHHGKAFLVRRLPVMTHRVVRCMARLCLRLRDERALSSHGVSVAIDLTATLVERVTPTHAPFQSASSARRRSNRCASFHRCSCRKVPSQKELE
jgi:hypothetical protein